MQTYHIRTTVNSDGILTIKGLPLKAGENVEIVVRQFQIKNAKTRQYPLRGKITHYDAPFKSVAEKDWEVLK